MGAVEGRKWTTKISATRSNLPGGRNNGDLMER
jgi:hypothetical protein